MEEICYFPLILRLQLKLRSHYSFQWKYCPNVFFNSYKNLQGGGGNKSPNQINYILRYKDSVLFNSWQNTFFPDLWYLINLFPWLSNTDFPLGGPTNETICVLCTQISGHSLNLFFSSPNADFPLGGPRSPAMAPPQPKSGGTLAPGHRTVVIKILWHYLRPQCQFCRHKEGKKYPCYWLSKALGRILALRSEVVPILFIWCFFFTLDLAKNVGLDTSLFVWC